MRIKKKLGQKQVILILSFFLPVIIMLLAYGIVQFWPIGDRSPLTIDLYHQYVSFISEFRRKIMTGKSLFYSWSVGLGTNFYSLLAYYSASPLNLFLVFFPQNHITEAVTFLTVTKLGLAGLSFSYFLSNAFARQGLYSIRSKFRIEDCKSEDYGTDAFIVALSVAYALCGFNLAFSWDIMWLDVVALLPMVTLGVHKLIREQKFKLYAFSLAAALVTNYYIAFFVCMFTALYFFVSYFTAKSEEEEDKVEEVDRILFWPTAIRFGIITLIGAALSAFLLYPTVLALADTSAAGDAFPTAMNFRFSFFDFMTYQLMNISPSIRDGLPNIYNGILAFIFLPIYILSDRIPFKEKISHLLLLAFLFVSFNLNTLDFLWHGMHYPNQLPYRYSFLFSFLLLIMVFRALTVMREFKPRTLALHAAFGVVFVILAEELNPDELGHGYAYLNILFFVVYLLLFLSIWKKNYFRTIALLIAVVMVGEIAINTVITVGNIAKDEVYTSRSGFIKDFEDVGVLTDIAKQREADDFYRLEVMPAKTTNDGALYGYPGFTLFSSTSREDTAKLFRKLAYHGNNINSYKYTASTPLGNSLFGIKYLLLKNGASRDILLEEVARSGEMTLLENPYALEVGLVANQDFFHWEPMGNNPFDSYNNMIRKMAGLPEVFHPVTPKVTEGANFHPSTGDGKTGLRFAPENRSASTLMKLELPVTEDQYVYFAFDTNKTTTINIKTRRSDGNGTQTTGVVGEGVVGGSVVGDGVVGEGVTNKSTSANQTTEAAGQTTEAAEQTVQLAENRSIHWIETFDVGYCKAGDVVEISFEQKEDKATDVTIYGAVMNLDEYKNTMEALHERALDVTEWSVNRIVANYQAEEDGVIYLSIPYDQSWKAKIDGEAVETDYISNKALLAVPTKAGEHTIELSFVPKGFGLGLTASILALALLALLTLDEKKWKAARDEKFRQKRLEAIEKKKNSKKKVPATGDSVGADAGVNSAPDAALDGALSIALDGASVSSVPFQKKKLARATVYRVTPVTASNVAHESESGSGSGAESEAEAEAGSESDSVAKSESEAVSAEDGSNPVQSDQSKPDELQSDSLAAGTVESENANSSGSGGNAEAEKANSTGESEAVERADSAFESGKPDDAVDTDQMNATENSEESTNSHTDENTDKKAK